MLAGVALTTAGGVFIKPHKVFIKFHKVFIKHPPPTVHTAGDAGTTQREQLPHFAS